MRIQCDTWDELTECVGHHAANGYFVTNKGGDSASGFWATLEKRAERTALDEALKRFDDIGVLDSDARPILRDLIEEVTS